MSLLSATGNNCYSTKNSDVRQEMRHGKNSCIQMKISGTISKEEKVKEKNTWGMF